MGTLKDISFPLEGEYAGGLVAKSLVGAGREIPLAGQTGATVQQESQSDARAEPQSSRPSESYSVQLVQYSPEPAETPNKVSAENFPHTHRKPSKGFSLKKSSGKRVTFTVAQKEEEERSKQSG